MLTLGQAAKETGLSKPTISKAIKKGTLSATYNQQERQYQIDPAELFRVYPPVSKQPVTNLQDETPVYTNDLQRELEVLREERTRERAQLEATISDLRTERERLLKVIEEQAGSVKQLSFKPQQEAATERRAWPVLVALLALAGGMVAVLYALRYYGLL